jgi:autotransporter translocation and assembly factor TamB
MTRNECCVDTILIAFIWGCLASAAYAQMGAPNTVQKGAPVATHANGTFEVKLEPLAADDKTEGSTLSRMSIDKHFHGDLEATSKGEMLSAMTDVKGSAGYVAMERVTGTLKGRTGSFVLQHSATMTRGTPELSITVVPDSGSGQLVGLTGKMDIKINEGKHSYDFEYALPAAP